MTGGAAPPLCYRFWVERNQRRIGTHAVTVTASGALLRAVVAIDLTVGLGPIALYRYRHDSQEVWQNNLLMSLDARTNINGRRQAVRARQIPEGLAITSGESRHILSADSLPTSYWHPETTGPRPLFDTQSGRPLQIERQPVGAGRWRLKGDLTLLLDYAPQDRWTGLRFRLHGADFCYQPQQD